ncbi:MAG TPA: protein kinase, partial [Polyangiaceae bacterium]
LSARFLREARLAARAKSPHFVRVFDFGKLDTGVPYLVMEMLTGHDLGAELREMGPLPIDQAVDYVLQASLGLAELHAMGVVHRDLKPSNLFLADAAGTRTLKVLDLGLITDPGKGAQGLTSTGHVFGTPHYMSPEQIKESKSVDARSDVWALGVILYELLTGSLPFGQGAESTGEVFGLILHTEPLALREQRPALPAGIEAVVHRCLRRAPEERYPNLAELGAALVPFGGPIAGERVDGIRKALAAKPADPPRAPEHDLPSGAAGDVSSAPTVQATPGGPAPMRPPVVRTPAPALPARGTARAEVPTGAGPFAKALTPPPAPPKTVGRGMVIGIAVGAVVLVPVLVFALRGHGAPAASLQPTAAETAPAPSALAATPMASTPPAATTIASTTPASTS